MRNLLNAERATATIYAVLCAAAIVACLTAIAPAPLAAQGWIQPGPRPWTGTGPATIVKLRTHVDVQIDDRVARVEVEEWFENRSPVVAEGAYLYPLSGEAVFSGFSLYQGDRELRGEMMVADEARRIYRNIVRRRKDPALIELVGHGLIRARVFPIQPGQTRNITLRYTQVLERAGDALEFRYAAGGPSNSGASGRAARINRVPANVRPETNQALHAVASAPLDFTMTVEDGERFRDPFSPTHALEIDRDDGRLTVRPEGDLRGDFAVFLPLARGLVGMTLVTHRPSTDEPGFFLLTLSPGEADGPAVPRDVTVVLDVSGSMSGTKIRDAKRALRQLLGTLSPSDRFRLIAFSNQVRSFSGGWTDVDARALREARSWVDGLHADGGTAIDAALAEAFAVGSTSERLPIVVFLTDGLPTVGERNPEKIAERAERMRGRARVFAFGVGYNVNTYLLGRLTAAGRGATEYLEPGEQVEAALATLAAKIQHPVLTDLAIAGAPVELVEIYPSTLPDLFAGEALVLLGRWRDEGDGERGELRMQGRRTGRVERFAVEATFPARESGNDYLPRLWASRKIGELVREMRLHGPNEELVNEVRRLALRYGIITEYTAYLVREPLNLAMRGLPIPLDQDITIAATSFQATPAGGPPADHTASAATGAAAVKAAESARRRRSVATAAEVAAMGAQARETLERALAAANLEARTVAGRVFLLEDGVWTDAQFEDDTRVVRVRPYSDAYFALLRALPELTRAFVEFEHVLVAGDAVGIRVADGGRETIGEAELDEIVAAFRG